MFEFFIPATTLCGIFSLTAAVPATVAAPRHDTQTDEERQEEVELLKELDNPISNLTRVSIQSNWDFGIGPVNAMRYTADIQPIIPFKLNKDWYLITRTILPVFYAEPARAGASRSAGMGDMGQSFFFTPTKTADGWIVGAGPSFVYPSASEHSLGAEKWGAGPSLAVLQQRKGWTYGVVAGHLWSFAGASDRRSVNVTGVEPFVSYITRRLTSIGLKTASAYDWTNRQRTVPVDLFATQVLKIGGQSVSFGLGARYYAEKPAGGPDWGMQFTVTLLFPK